MTSRQSTTSANSLPEPVQPVPAARPADDGRGRARVNASARHPLAWLHSHIAHHRGVRDAAPVPTSAADVLDRLVGLKVSTWTYGFDHESVRHLGPMAQDFAETFGLGSQTRKISIVDANGVCIASIQALHRRLVDAEEEIARLRAQLDAAAADSSTTDSSGDHSVAFRRTGAR